MKNIHLIPTDKPSRLHLWTDENGTRPALCGLEYSHTRNTQNIYITSDEEIKVGDWVIEFQKGDNIGEVHFINGEYVIANDIQKKIIITTDQDLERVQAIDNDFLEWFVKNPSCEEVEVTLIQTEPLKGFIYNFEYKIIIPKETKLIHQQIIDAVGGEDRFRKICKIEPKQETLEEFAERLYPTTFVAIYTQKDKVDKNKERRKLLIEGTKWQQEQDKNKYSEDEVRRIAEWSFHFHKTNDFSDSELADEWELRLEKMFKNK